MIAPNRTAVLAAALGALGAASVGVWALATRPGPALDCPPSQVRLDENGVATCGPGAEPAAAQTLALGARLPLNRASAEELAAIDGVGPALARAIVEARARRDGGFASWDELDAVAGVGPARLSALQAAATLEP